MSIISNFDLDPTKLGINNLPDLICSLTIEGSYDIQPHITLEYKDGSAIKKTKYTFKDSKGSVIEWQGQNASLFDLLGIKIPEHTIYFKVEMQPDKLPEVTFKQYLSASTLEYKDTNNLYLVELNNKGDNIATI